MHDYIIPNNIKTSKHSSKKIESFMKKEEFEFFHDQIKNIAKKKLLENTVFFL